MKERLLTKSNEAEFLKRVNHLSKLVKRDRQRFMFMGYPEWRIDHFISLKDTMQKLRPDGSLKCIVAATASEKQVLRDQLVSFFNRMTKRLAKLEPSLLPETLETDYSEMSDNELVHCALQIISQAQNHPDFFEELRFNAATNQSLQGVVDQFSAAIEDVNQATAQRVQYEMDRTAILSELCQIMRELCDEGQRLWTNVNANNYHDYAACAKASLEKAYSTLS